MKDKISMRQAGIIIFLTIFSNKILLLPALMYKNIEADSLFAVIMLFAIELLCLPILMSLKRKFPGDSLHDILKRYITAVGAKLVYTILMLFMLFKILLTFSIVYVYFKQQVYQNEFIWIAFVAFIPVINHAFMSGLKPTARTMELFFGLILAGFIFCLVISLFTPISTPYFFEAGAKEVFLSLYEYAFAFGDFIFIFLIVDKIDYKKSEEKQVYFYSVLSMFLVILMFFLFYSKYQITSFIHNNALADLLVFSVQFNAIGRLDIIAMLTLMMVTLMQMEVFCYGFCQSLIEIFPLLDKKYAIVVFDITFFIMYYVFIGKYESIVGLTVSYLPILGVIVGYAFPLLIFIVNLIKRRKNEEKD